MTWESRWHEDATLTTLIHMENLTFDSCVLEVREDEKLDRRGCGTTKAS